MRKNLESEKTISNHPDTAQFEIQLILNLLGSWADDKNPTDKRGYLRSLRFISVSPVKLCMHPAGARIDRGPVGP